MNAKTTCRLGNNVLSFLIFIFATSFLFYTSNAQAPIKKLVPKFTVKTYKDDTVYVEKVNGTLDRKIVYRKPDTLFTIVETPPKFTGGDSAMMKFLQANVQYPQEAKEKKIQAKIYVQCIVDKEGQLQDIDVKKIPPSGESLANEAIRVVQRMPAWQPGMQNGKKVNVEITIPVLFKLGK